MNPNEIKERDIYLLPAGQGRGLHVSVNIVTHVGSGEFNYTSSEGDLRTSQFAGSGLLEGVLVRVNDKSDLERMFPQQDVRVKAGALLELYNSLVGGD